MSLAEKINERKEKPLLLFTPLDWGLGHTTRCIPLIRELLKINCLIIVACNSTQKALLIAEFPSLGYVPLRGYGLKYGRNRLHTYIKLLLQIPKILIEIKRENTWLSQFITENAVDAVISDNRYGCYSPKLPSVLITHQLNIRTGAGEHLDRFIQRINYKLISRFNECWIPDFKGEKSIAGKLSQPKSVPQVPLQYLGCLSRFKILNIPVQFDVLILLSGPEPQRTILENLLLPQLRDFGGRCALVRGLPENNALPGAIREVLMLNHVPGEALNQMICASGMVISRSGYTTIMDLLKLHKKMILIPTPAQAEQEYLAAYLSAKNLALAFDQDKFSLTEAIKKAEGFQYQFRHEDMEIYKEILHQFVDALG